jgi:hypothetical protein
LETNGDRREAVDVGALCRSGRPAYTAIAAQSDGAFADSDLRDAERCRQLGWRGVLGTGQAVLDAAVFERCFIAWMRSLCGAFEGLQVALDGKTVRRSKSSGQKAIHMVSAFAHDLGLTLGQVKTAEKSNEITAIPELLEALLLKGCIVIIDAMGSQKAIAAKIIQQESDYALLVKNNQPSLAAAIEGFFEAAARTGY